MSNIVGRVEKVSFDQYLEQMIKLGFVNEQSECFNEELEKVKAQYEKIELPTRATSGSAGYDFYIPMNINIRTGAPVVIPTGIRSFIEPGWFLEMVPRSGLGFKYGLRLENTCGIIDSDYYFADNEGHIMLKMAARTSFCINEGDRFAQGIFLPHGITSDDRPLKAARLGGFGSTGV